MTLSLLNKDKMHLLDKSKEAEETEKTLKRKALQEELTVAKQRKNFKLCRTYLVQLTRKQRKQ